MEGRIMTKHLVCGVCAASLLLGTATLAWAGGTTQRVSLGQGGVQGNAFSESFGAISAGGRYVAFTSEATNLVPSDTNGLADVFVRDRQSGTTQRISVSTSGTEGNGISYDAHLSAGGRFVAFRSQGSTLVPNDTNGAEDAFVHDRKTGTTRRVSIRTGGGQANGSVVGVDISADGRFVTFTSNASNLVPGDTNGFLDLFVRDRMTGITSRVNVGPGGVECPLGGSGGAMSADGRYVAFNSSCSNIVKGGTNGQAHAFVRDRQTGTNQLVSRNSAGAQGNGLSFAGDLSADGRFCRPRVTGDQPCSRRHQRRERRLRPRSSDWDDPAGECQLDGRSGRRFHRRRGNLGGWPLRRVQLGRHKSRSR